MTTVPVDIAPRIRPRLPEIGLERGWEPAVLLGAALLLFCFGLVNLYSASTFLAERQARPDHYYMLRQAAGGAAGLLALALAARIPYTWWRVLAWPLLVVTFFALLLLVLPWTSGIAPEINGARRWLTLGVTIQPSEPAKLVLLIWTAHMAVRKQPVFDRFSLSFVPILIGWGLIVPLILLQPDLSTGFLAGMLGAVVLFTAGARIRHFLLLGVIFLPLAWLQLRRGFRIERVTAFRSGEAGTGEIGYQAWQSLIALGSGGATGVGFGEGRQKFGFLPEPHNDFIFSMIGEEWGFLGVLLLIGLYLTIVVVGFRIARMAPDLFGRLVGVGIASFIALHAVLHMAVGLGVIPVTGLPLPLVSFGRSNLIVTFASIGILMSIARGDPNAKSERPLRVGKVSRV